MSATQHTASMPTLKTKKLIILTDSDTYIFSMHVSVFFLK